MKIYLVGGAIRNKLLNLPVKDKDWVVVGSTPEKMIKDGYKQVGNSFPVFLHPISKEEYALARTEKKKGNGYTGFLANFSSDISLKEDLIRRDLTINAIAQDKNGKYIDPYGGLKDIKSKLLRHISDAFIEDPLRVLRVARFASYLYQLGFHIHEKTMYLMKKMVKKGELNFLKPERIWKETEYALKGPNPQVFFSILIKCKSINVLFPEIYNYYQIYKKKITIKNTKYVFKALSIISKLNFSIEIRFSVFLFYIIKTIKLLKIKVNKKQYFFHGNSLISKLCKRLHLSKEIYKLSILAIKYSYKIQNIKKQNANSIIEIFNNTDAWRNPSRIKKIIIISNININFSLKTNMKIYKKKHLLQKILKKVSNIDIKSVIQNGFQGKEIKEQIKVKRIQKINSILQKL